MDRTNNKGFKGQYKKKMGLKDSAKNNLCKGQYKEQ